VDLKTVEIFPSFRGKESSFDNTLCSLGPHFFDLSKQAIGTMFSRSLSLAILCLSLVAKKCHVRAYLHTHVKRGVSSTAVVGVHSKDKSERKEVSLSCWLCTKRSTMSTHTVCLDCFSCYSLRTIFDGCRLRLPLLRLLKSPLCRLKMALIKLGREDVVM
jgi:hypothetical protein